MGDSNGSRFLIITSILDKNIPDGHRDILMYEADNHCCANKTWGSPFEGRGCTASRGLPSLHCETCRTLRYASLADACFIGLTLGLWAIAGMAIKNKFKRRPKTSITEESANIVASQEKVRPEYFLNNQNVLLYKYKGRWMTLCNVSSNTQNKAWPHLSTAQ